MTSKIIANNRFGLLPLIDDEPLGFRLTWGVNSINPNGPEKSSLESRIVTASAAIPVLEQTTFTVGNLQFTWNSSRKESGVIHLGNQKINIETLFRQDKGARTFAIASCNKPLDELVLFKLTLKNHGNFSFYIKLEDRLKKKGIGRLVFNLVKDTNPELFSRAQFALGFWSCCNEDLNDNYLSLEQFFKQATNEKKLPKIESHKEFYALDSKRKNAILEGSAKTFTGRMYAEFLNLKPVAACINNSSAKVFFKKTPSVP